MLLTAAVCWDEDVETWAPASLMTDNRCLSHSQVFWLETVIPPELVQLVTRDFSSSSKTFLSLLILSMLPWRERSCPRDGTAWRDGTRDGTCETEHSSG